VAQVVGAGYTLGPATGDIATIVKLFRVAMLAVVVVVVSMAFKAERERDRERAREHNASAAGPTATATARQPLVPWFLWLFAALVAVNSAGALAAPLQQGLSGLSRACLVVAIAALGMKTTFKALIAAGWRPVAVMVLETVWIGGLVLAVVELFT
jgi:uncharacterized membrane protein YadS